MATIAKLANASLASLLPDDQVSGLTAGEALTPFDCVYIKSDGKVWLTVGNVVAAADRYRGVVPGTHAVGDKNVTIYFGNVTVNYAAGMTPGKDLYLSATPGRLDDAATEGDARPVAFVIDTTRVRFLGPIGSVTTDTTRPVVASATIDAAGTTLTVTFTERSSPPVLPATGATGFALTASGGAATLSAPAISGTTYTATISRAIQFDEVVTLAYTPGNVTDSAAAHNALAAFTGTAVTNNSTQGA